MKKVVLENKIVKRLLNNPKALEEIPSLRGYAARRNRGSGCGRCSRRSDVVNDLKIAIAERMSKEHIAALKKLLGADSLVVNYNMAGRPRKAEL